MIDDEKTPVDPLGPMEMILRKLGEVGTDAKLAVTEAREAKGHSQNTYNLQLELNEHLKTVDRRVTAISQRLVVVEASRVWLPLIAIVLAAIALAKAW
ncbi:hypothetical protein [Caudoviricetes sp.]|nr:hypothetical protein [Caudoviricetes sp.]